MASAVAGRTVWLDPSVRQQPFGELTDRALDAEALILPLPGEPAEVARTPARTGRREGRELDVRAALAADGSAEVAGVDRYHGALGASAKAAFERLDERSRRQAVEQLLTRSIRGFEVAEVAVEGEEDPGAPLTLRWRGRAPALAREAADALLVELPLAQARLGARLAQRSARTTPFQLEASELAELRLAVTPPPGAAPRPGSPERRESPAGLFTQREQVVDGALVRQDRLELRRGRIPAAAASELAAFAGAVDAIQARPLVFGRPVATAEGGSPGVARDPAAGGVTPRRNDPPP